MGSAAAYHLTRRGRRVLGLERFAPAHAEGSSHGGSRVIRLAYFEGPEYVPLLLRAYQLWRALEEASGSDLLLQTGGMLIGPPGSDLVTAEPVVCREWLRPGTHVNSVGHNPAGTGEVDLATVLEALVVVESRSAALAEAIELRQACDAGMSADEIVHAELGELMAGTRPGRAGDDQITLYKSVGHAVQDAAAAALILQRAFSSPAEGTPVEQA